MNSIRKDRPKEDWKGTLRGKLKGTLQGLLNGKPKDLPEKTKKDVQNVQKEPSLPLSSSSKKQSKPSLLEAPLRVAKMRFLRQKRQEVKKKKQKGFRIDIRSYLLKAGITMEPFTLAKLLFKLALLLTFLLTAYFLYELAKAGEFRLGFLAIMLIIIWVGAFASILFIVWLLAFVIIDLRMHQRRIAIEQLLPDFLQLTAANINGGMTIDKALWHAVRPRFGVLAKEIEVVAKETVSGTELSAALRDFSAKYDSKTLKRSLNLLIEGIEGGGRVGELLTRISMNIKDQQLMKEEMAANVSNYVIFIAAASTFGLPILLALAGKLMQIISTVMSQVSTPTDSSGLGFSLSGPSLAPADYTLFAMGVIVVTTVFSSMIIAVIQKGEARQGIRYMPGLFLVTLLMYLGAKLLFNTLLGGFF